MAGPGKVGRKALTLEGWTQIKIRREDKRVLDETAAALNMTVAELMRAIVERLGPCKP